MRGRRSSRPTSWRPSNGSRSRSSCGRRRCPRATRRSWSRRSSTAAGQVIFFPPRSPGQAEFARRPLDELGRQGAGSPGRELAGRSGPAGPDAERRGAAGRRSCRSGGTAGSRASSRRWRRSAGGAPLARAGGDRTRGGVYFCATTPAAGDSSLATERRRPLRAGPAGAGRGGGGPGQHAAARRGRPGRRGSRRAGSGWRAAEAALSTDYPLHRGVYRAGERLLAVNRAAAEDLAPVLADERVAELFRGLDFARVDDRAGSISSLIQEIWRLFLVAMMVAMVVEAGLCLPKAARPRGAVVMSVSRSLTFLWTPWSLGAVDPASCWSRPASASSPGGGAAIDRVDGAARAAAAGAGRARWPSCSISRNGSRSTVPRRSRRSPCSGTPRPAWRRATSWHRRKPRRPAQTRARGRSRRWPSRRLGEAARADERRRAAVLAGPGGAGHRPVRAACRRPPRRSRTCAASCWPPTATGTRGRRRCRPRRGCGSRACPSSPCRVGSPTRLPDVELLEPRRADVRRRRQVGADPVHDRELAAARVRHDGHAADVRRRRGHQGSADRPDEPHQRLAGLEAEGDRRLHAHARRSPSTATRRSTDNNQLTAPIAIREEKLRVLVVESYPRWEYRYLRNALSRDPGVEVSCLLFHPGLSKVGGGNKDYIKQFPAGLDELSKYDVVFLGDVGVDDGQLTAEQCRLLKGLVEHQASGLVFMPGMQGRQFSLLDTELGDLCPVVLDPAQPGGWGSRTPNHFELTETGPAQPAHQAGRHAGRQCRGLGGPARLSVVRAGAAGQGRQRGAVRAQGRHQRVRPASAAGHAHLRRGQGAVHGDRRRLAVAEGGRRQVPLSLLGPGRALDGLSAKHGQGRNDAAVLRARPAEDEPDARAPRQRDGPERRAAPRRRGHGADHGPVGQGGAGAVQLGGRRVGRLQRAVTPRTSRASTR